MLPPVGATMQVQATVVHYTDPTGRVCIEVTTPNGKVWDLWVWNEDIEGEFEVDGEDS